MTTTATMLKRVVTYERVSTEDQKERETIRTQQEELVAVLDKEPGVTLCGAVR